MKRLPIMASLLALGACSSMDQSIKLRDPQTQQVVECKADPMKIWSWDTARWQEDCAQKYERNGFTRLK
jgi:hypothetical protein